MPGRIEGKIVAINDAGNLISDISADQLRDAPTNDCVTVRCDEHVTQGIFTADHDQPEFTLIAMLGESGCLELVIVGDSAKIMLGVSVSETITVQWEV